MDLDSGVHGRSTYFSVSKVPELHCSILVPSCEIAKVATPTVIPVVESAVTLDITPMAETHARLSIETVLAKIEYLDLAMNVLNLAVIEHGRISMLQSNGGHCGN